jgi:hypothetical protein
MQSDGQKQTGNAKRYSGDRRAKEKNMLPIEID